MAALVAGVQYGLSSHSNFSENKSLIFVKLTDSAQRAIEDFLRNRNKTNQNPTIQFLGNEGQLSFPSTQSSHGSAGFTFSLSGNQDIEGPQGGFECIQQTGSKSLQSLGTLPCKMRIQANDDVYETTRHRMAVAEENNKNKCTRVIKANGPDIGRKVKVKSSGRTIPPPIPNARHRESTSIPTSSSQSSRSQSSSALPTPPTAILSSSSSSFSSYKPIQNSNPPPIRTQPEKKFSDIMRRPLRERLIHLLALRPYKRPELYNRITTEGIKERDRSTIATLLKQLAFMRDNTYHLHRHVWNDVQEDWPFYTEQEKAMLKRRKPQNLTPPGSSDGSSGSGQSPNSTHAGSPPAITAPPPGLMSLKRPGYYQSADGLQTKKPRISHFRKSDSGATTGSGNSNGNNRENARTTGSNSSSGTVNNNLGNNHHSNNNLSYNNNSTSNNNHSVNGNISRSSMPGESNSAGNIGGGSLSVVNFVRSSSGTNPKSSGNSVLPNGSSTERRDREDRGSSRASERERERGRDVEREYERDRESRETKSAAGTNSYNDFPNSGASGNSANNGGSIISSPPALDSVGNSDDSDYPDYRTQYTPISCMEQRSRYREEFEADYEEYRAVHTEVVRVAQRFTAFQAQLQQEQMRNPERYQAIKNQIMEAYVETRKDPVHTKTKKRFDYLHKKLSYIKQLVDEWDAKILSGNGNNSGGGDNNENGNGGTDYGIMGGLRN